MVAMLSFVPAIAAQEPLLPPLLLIPPIDPATGASATIAVASVDPMRIDDDDFARNRDPARWDGLVVQAVGFRDLAIPWRLWRIRNAARPYGPLWVVPHDNENATFAAALDAVRQWGGTVIAVDTALRDDGYAARFNHADAARPATDPNRHFTEERSAYREAILGDLTGARQPIIALHANAEGADPSLARCHGEGMGYGAGDISVALCTDRMVGRRSPTRRWPFDDDDTLALVPHRTDGRGSYCGGAMAEDGFNMIYEAVEAGDGSLSNYAARHGLAYVNLETRDRGNSPAGLAEARDRLVAMIDDVLERCAPIAGLALRHDPEASAAPATRRPAAKGRRRSGAR